MTIWKSEVNMEEENFYMTVEELYNTLSIGQELHNEFKVGSFIFNGDFSRLKITVENKHKVKK